MRGAYDEVLMAVIDEKRVRARTYGNDIIDQLLMCLVIFGMLLFLTIIF